MDWVRNVEPRQRRDANQTWNPDQFEGPENRDEYVRDRYEVACRNREQLERHIAELEDFYASQHPETPLGHIWRTTDLDIQVAGISANLGFSYIATLPPDVLEWVKGRDDVIRIRPDKWLYLDEVELSEEPDVDDSAYGLCLLLQRRIQVFQVE
jgi:hypothetical protein